MHAYDLKLYQKAQLKELSNVKDCNRALHFYKLICVKHEDELEPIHDLDSEISPTWIRFVRRAYECDVSPNNIEVLLTRSLLAPISVF